MKGFSGRHLGLRCLSLLEPKLRDLPQTLRAQQASCLWKGEWVWPSFLKELSRSSFALERFFQENGPLRLLPSEETALRQHRQVIESWRAQVSRWQIQTSESEELPLEQRERWKQGFDALSTRILREMARILRGVYRLRSALVSVGRYLWYSWQRNRLSIDKEARLR